MRIGKLPPTATMVSRGEIPSVGELVWVRTSSTEEELATVLNVDCEFDDNNVVDGLAEKRISRNGILVEFNVSKYQAVHDQSALRQYTTSPIKTRRQRQIVTPSPTEMDDEEKKRKRITTEEQQPAKTRKRGSEVETESRHFSPKAAPKKVAADKNDIKPSKRIAKQVESISVQKSAPDGDGSVSSHDSSEEESDDDRPFQVEYSTTGRATCRRCDELIPKGMLRVSHVPLFRGKPGFKVYRHLKCAVFSEEVITGKDVGGWKQLKKEDYQELVQRVEASKVEIQTEKEELDPDELVPVSFQGEIRSPPKGLIATMLPFQVEGTSWMYHQEVQVESCRGGILADEMGLGKTLQSIVTILDNRPLLQHSSPEAKHPPSAPDMAERKAEEKLWSACLADWKKEMEMINVPKSLFPKGKGKKADGGARAGTLVICPVIALTQWKTEIEKFTENGALTVGTYHGPNRASETPRELMQKYDVVLTTYQVLEADFRKMTSPNKVKCPNCGGRFKVDKLRVHLKYFCGENAQRTEAQARQRRSRDQNERPRAGGGGGSPRSGKDSKKTVTPKASKKPAPKSRTQPKKAVRVKSSKDFDSESDLSFASLDERVSVSRARPSRAAAVTATKQLSKSKTQWAHNETETDSDEYSVEEVSSDEERSDDESIERGRSGRQRTQDVSASESDSEEESRLQRARKRQAEALKQAKASKTNKKPEMKKKPEIEKKSEMKKKSSKKRKTTGKGTSAGKKGSPPDDSSTDEDDHEPIDDIDMDRLIQEAMQGSQMSVLHSMCWFRIILDEAHMIKSRSSQTANAAFSLIGIHRWCLSGTPLQNRVGELYSLIRFLRIDPMAHYFCRAKECDCKSLHYRMLNGKCQGCGHGSVQHFSHFNKHVLNPIQRSGYTGDGRRAMFRLKSDILDKCLLRRTKETRAEDLNLPPRLVTIRSVRLHPIEEDFYNALYTQTKTSFNDYVADSTLLNNYAAIFDLLMRMRQAVDHPYLVVYSKKGVATHGGANQPAVANGSIDCDLCHEPPTDRVLSSCCRAAFCRSCVVDYMSSLLSESDGIITPCPSCRSPFSIDLNQVSESVVDDGTLNANRDASGTSALPSLKELPHVATGSILRRINLAEYATSSKIEALTQELVNMRQTSPGSKAIVFSQFVNMLDLIRWRLHSDPCLAKMGLGARALHGSMDVKARDASLKDFREDGNVRVLLISLKAGGVALNLTVANHIYLMDPWWNPAAEMQAIDRTHRLGQCRPIRAVRFIAEGTVDERILQLQEKKRLVFDGTVGRDAGSLKMLTVDDMKSLFA